MNKLIFLFFVLFFISISSQTKVLTVGKEDLKKTINERNNKSLLINIWATWCIACREEFPDLVRLSQEYSNKIDFIAISVDYPDEVGSKVIPFIDKNNVTFPVYISGFNKDEELIELLNKNWNGALPASFIYDKEGVQIKFLEGKHSYDSFSSILKALF